MGVSLAAVLWRAKYLYSFPLGADEGIHLMWLRLLGAGFEPYSEVYITYPPLYPLAIETVWNLWPTETAQRWFSVAYALFGAIGVALIARKFAGTIAGVAAAALTLFSPVLLEPSRAIMGEFPSVAWSVWAIFFAWLYRDPPQTQPGLDGKTGRRLWLILSALCLAFSLSTKLLSPVVAFLIPLMLVINRQPQEQPQDLLDSRTPQPLSLSKSGLLDLTVWGLALFLPMLILVLIYDLGPMFEQVVDQRLKSRDVFFTAGRAYWRPRYEFAATFFREDTALVVLALIGLPLAWQRRLKDRWIVLAWLGLAAAMLVIHNPIRYKHFLILIPPLAILGGVTVEALASGISSIFLRAGKRPEPAGRAWSKNGLVVGGLILLGALYLWQIPATLELLQARAAIPQPPLDEQEALAFIREVTAPEDCLISDDMPLLYWSGRMTPPELAEVSSNRLDSGALTLEELTAITDAYDCQLVAAITNRLPKYLPPYMEWVKRKYLGRFHYGAEVLYFAKIDTDPQPATPLWANFDDQIIFTVIRSRLHRYAPGARRR